MDVHDRAPRRPRRTGNLLLALAALAAGALGPAASTDAATLAPLRDPAPAAVAPAGFDRGLGADPGARAAQDEGSTTVALRTPDGTTIPVTLTRAYAGQVAVAQTYADFLASLPHGDELATVRMTIGTAAEVGELCGGGPGLLACYVPGSRRMIVPGEQTRADGLTTSYVIAHEYGHHVAASRSNDPFPALDYGPKRWASRQRVCAAVLDGRLSPGDEGEDYARNPGEAWAETYAQLRYPGVPWRYVGLLRPDAGDLAAARSDVLRPWRTGRVRTFTGRVSAAAPARRHRFRLRLDGTLVLRLRGPARAELDLQLRSGDRVVRRTTRAGSTDRIRMTAACRTEPTETLTVTVRRRAGAGAYRLIARYAG